MLQGSSVLDVLNQMLKLNGFRGTIDASGYVSSISDGDTRVLNERDNGPNSGWMYTLNGVRVDRSIKEQTVKNGDRIIFHYTDDYRIEDESLDISEAERLMEMIGRIPDEVTLDDESLVNEIRGALESLDANDPVLSGLITKSMRSKLTQASERISELKGEKEQEDAEEAARALERSKKEAMEKMKKIASEYAGRILPADDDKFTAVLMDAISKIDSALNKAEVQRIVDTAVAKLEKLAGNKKIAAARKRKVKKITIKAKKAHRFTVTWKKVSGASGYQIQMRKSGGKWKPVKKTAKMKVTTHRLKKGGKYQFRIRTYTRISGRNYYGKWTLSKKKKCK